MSALPIRCVIDASVGIKQVVAEPGSSLAHALFARLIHDPATSFHVPDLFFLECANILWRLAVRQNILTPAQAVASLAALKLLRLTPVTDLSQEALDIAVAHDITVYDATYVAARLKVPLITADGSSMRKSKLGCDSL